MTSSKPTSGKYTVEGVELSWVDNGKKMFNIYLTRDDGTKWTARRWARDELDAYAIAMREYEAGERYGLSE
jgi:hypothetical protein